MVLIVVIGGIIWGVISSLIPNMNRMYIYPVITGSMTANVHPYHLLIFIVISEIIGSQLEIFQYIQPITNSQNYEAGEEAAEFYIRKRKTRYLLKHLGFQFFISGVIGIGISLMALLVFNELETLDWSNQYISITLYILIWSYFIINESNKIHCLIYSIFNILFSYLFITRFNGIDTNSLMMSFGFLLFSLNVDQYKNKKPTLIQRDSRAYDGTELETIDGTNRFCSLMLSILNQYLVGIQSSVILYQFKKWTSHIDYLSMLSISKGISCSLGLTYSLMQLMSKDAAANYLNLLLQDIGITSNTDISLYIYLLIGICITLFMSINIYTLLIEHYIKLQNKMAATSWKYIPLFILGINLVITSIYIGNIFTLLPLIVAFYFLNLYRKKRSINSLFSLTGIGALPLFSLLHLL